MTTSIILNIFSLLCGVALFLYGMQQGEKNIQKLGKTRLRQMIAGITKHRLSAYITGFFTTIITQSSSATTVMVVGLASVQLMTLRQSLGVILGADLGTTVTVGLFALKFSSLSPLFIFAGFALTFSKRFKLAGKLVLAIGFVFYGMLLMADASSSLRTLPSVQYTLLHSLSNPLVGLLAGALLTAVIQSSAATLALLIAMAGQFTFAGGGAPGLAAFFPIVLGANIGTCATALLAMLQAETDGIRVAWAHLLFKVFGAAIALPFLWVLPFVTIAAGWPVAIQVAALHVAFNLYISAMFLPLIPLFDRVIRRFVGQRRREATRFHAEFLNDKVVAIPALAFSQAAREISRMADLVAQMLDGCLAMIRNYDPAVKARVVEHDDEVDFLHEQIMTFLTGISRQELSEEESSRSTALIMITTDLEHAGDVASKSLAPLAEKIDFSPAPMTAEGKREIADFLTDSIELLRSVLVAFAHNDHELAGSLHERKKAVRNHFSELISCHMNRLYSHNVDSLQTTSIHIDLLEEIQRVNHFTFRIAAHVLGVYRAE
ncbi:MAG: Na/Pi cotransporter family protein [Chitinispirillaceae bacterium]|jgi:phosphate:Na+ symporter|nr:Na/Pi cotransporter family protein [Chitinispirillaceae bacterium]